MIKQRPKKNMDYQTWQVRCVIMAKLAWLSDDAIGPNNKIQDKRND